MLASFSIHSQTNYCYFYQGGKVYLNLDKSALYINTAATFQKMSIASEILLYYDLKNDVSAIKGELNKWSNNYIISPQTTQTNIDISSYPPGFYTIALVCNGDIKDAKTLIKN